MIFVVYLMPCFPSVNLKAKAAEEMQETQGQIDTLLRELSSLDQPDRRRSMGEMVTDSASSPASQGSLQSHSGMLQVRATYLTKLNLKSKLATCIDLVLTGIDCYMQITA